MSCQPQKKAAMSEQGEAKSESRKSVERRDWREERYIARSKKRPLFLFWNQNKGSGRSGSRGQQGSRALRGPRGSQGHNLIEPLFYQI